jgi:hypothetical protein
MEPALAPAALQEPQGLPPVCRRPPTPAGSRHQSPAAPVRTPAPDAAPERVRPHRESPMSQVRYPSLAHGSVFCQLVLTPWRHRVGVGGRWGGRGNLC